MSEQVVFRNHHQRAIAKVRNSPQVDKLLQLRAGGKTVSEAAAGAGLTKGQASGVLWRLGLGIAPPVIERTEYITNQDALAALDDAIYAVTQAESALRRARRELRRRKP